MATVSGKIYQVKDGTTNLFPRTVIEAVYGLDKTIADVETWVGNSFVKYSHGIYNPTSAVDLNSQHVAENTIQQISWDFYTYSNVTNRPTTGGSAASVLVLPNSWGGLQFYTDYNSNTYYIRNRYSTTGWKSWVQLYHSGNLTQSVITGLIGTTTYAPYKSSGYLPLAAQGATVYRTTSGQIVNFNNSKGANEEAYLVLQSNSTSKAAVGWSTTYGTYIYNYASAKYLGIKDDGTPHYQGNTLYHAGNANLSTVSWTCSTLTAYGVIEAKHAIYANRYNGQGNVAGASIVINKGGDYFGIGPSSTNVADLAFGTTSNNTGTWKSIWGYFSASVCSYTGVANVGGLKVTGGTKVTDGDGFEVYWDATNKRSVINSYGRGTGGSYYPMFFGASFHYFNAGNVGIFKNNPTYPLDVVGVIHSTVGIFSDGYVSALGTASSSDAKLKDDITTISYDRAKEVLSALNPSEWTWNALTSKEGERGAGMVAQEVEPILPDTVKEIGGNLTLEYNTLFAYGLAATKYMLPMVETHEEKIARLEKEVEELKRQLTN